MRFKVGRLAFKRAETESEFEQIHALNHATFVREIPQHEDPGDCRLVDRFHAKNVYFVALLAEKVVGMISVHDQPPFSVAAKLTDPGIMQAPDVRPLEVRLLAIEPCARRGTVIGGLTWAVYQHALRGAHTHLFISAFEDRLKLYARLGFQALGPAVAVGGARFVPMILPIARLRECNAGRAGRWGLRVEGEPS